jgi:cytochrome c556
MFRVAVITLMALGATGVMAMDQEKAEKVTEIRQAVLEVVGWNTGPMAAMAKENIPYDADEFAKRADRIAFMLDMLPDAFAPDTRDAVLETEALDVIWEERDDFNRLAGEARDKARAAETAARTGDFSAAQAAFLEMGQACKACHDRFREED